MLLEIDYLCYSLLQREKLLPSWVMGSHLLARSFSRHGYSLFLRQFDEVC